jgi:rhodanese-related sulfurtransferase/rubrerythrin
MGLTNANRKIESLSAGKAKEWLAGRREGDFLLLDVRQPQEYGAGHIPGAVLIPLPELIDKAKGLDPSKPVLAYCRSGNRSRAAAAFLLSEGFSSVYSIDGGITSWNGQVATGSYSEGLYLLEGRETTEELISLALALEEGSRMFYMGVSELTTDAEAKKTFKTIAEAEAKHKDTILETYGQVTGQHLDETLFDREPLKGVMEGGRSIEEVIGFLREKGRTLLDILEVSMQVETNALDLYIKIFRKIEDRNAIRVFEALIEEEKRHLARIGVLIGERAI